MLYEKIPFVLLHGENNSGIKTGSANYSKLIRSYQYGNTETQVLLFPSYQIIKIKPQVVICELAMGILNLPVIIVVCKILNIKLAFWSHGYNRKTGFNPHGNLIDRYRCFLIKWANANIVYSKFDREVIKPYLPNSPVFVAQNTLDIPTLTQIRNKLEIEGKNQVKRRLKISQEFNLVFIGRMLPSKNPEMLIDIYKKLIKDYNLRVGIHLIGEGEMLSKIRLLIEQENITDDFYLYGSLHEDSLSGEILYACDLMINPGALGLSINHAFCFDCPVISFASKNGTPAHGPEIEYIVNRKTGFLLENHSAEAVARTIFEYVNNKTLKEDVKNNIRYTVTNVFPLEKMVDGITECYSYLSSNGIK